MAPRLELIDADRAADVVSVLSDAFRAYPVMQYIIGAGHSDYDRRLRHLFEFFVFMRTRHACALGVSENDELEGAAIMTLPSEPPLSSDVEDKRTRLWRDLGDDARLRYETYKSATAAFTIGRPHHHLNMIGVRRRSGGRGLARPLLDAMARLSREHGDSAGVSLTTESPRNVGLYEHFGYRVQGHVRVTPRLESWGMWLETRP